MSNLLDKASIILTPTAYNNGEALCVKPSDGSGDFDFSRNSAATRVNAQGLVENVQILSSNLVQNPSFSEEGSEEVSNGSFSQEGVQLITNGDFATDSNWGKEVGWTISNGSLVANSVTTGLAFQSNIVEANKSYKATYSVVVTSGSIGLYFDGGTGYQGIVTTTQTITVFFKATTASPLYFRSNTSNFTGSIDNVSVREVGQDWTLGTGWSIAEDKAISDGTSGNNVLQQTIFSGSELGNYFKVQYEILSYTSGTLLLRSTGFHGAIAIDNSVGVHTLYLEATSTSTDLVFVTEAAGFNGSITNISVKEVGQNWSVTDADANNYVEFGDGTARLKFLNTSPVTTLKTSFAMTTGKKYKLTVDVLSITSGSIKVANAGINETFDTVGISTRIINPTAATTLNFYRATANVDLTLNSVNLIEITDDTNLPRINYEGFSYQDALGSELVTGANSGNINASSVYTDIYTNASVVNGKTYAVTFTAQDLENTIQSWSWTNYIPVDNSILYSNGTNTAYINATGNGNLNLRFYSPSGRTGSLSNISIKEYLGQEVVPDSGCGSWLFEPQSTNLITQSNDLSQWIIQQNATVSSPTFVSPSGENNANLIDLSADTDARVVLNFGSASTEYTFSVYLKKHESDIDGTFPLAYYNGSNYIKTYVNLTDKWQRFSLTFTNPSGSVFGYGLSRRGTTSDETLTRCYAWGGQQEALSYPTSLIPTEGSSVTRNQDVCTNGGSLASINSTEGTLYFEGNVLANTSSFEVISLSDGSISNILGLVYRNIANQFTGVVKSGGSTSLSKTITLADATSTIKAAISYKLNDFKFYVNGVLIIADTTGNTPIGLNTLHFADGDGTSNEFFGKTKALAVWKEALSDQELTELTTI